MAGRLPPCSGPFALGRPHHASTPRQGAQPQGWRGWRKGGLNRWDSATLSLRRAGKSTEALVPCTSAPSGLPSPPNSVVSRAQPTATGPWRPLAHHRTLRTVPWALQGPRGISIWLPYRRAVGHWKRFVLRQRPVSPPPPAPPPGRASNENTDKIPYTHKPTTQQKSIRSCRPGRAQHMGLGPSKEELLPNTWHPPGVDVTGSQFTPSTPRAQL